MRSANQVTLDCRRLRAVLDNDADALREVLLAFVAIQPPRMAALQCALQSSDLNEASRLVHLLVGSFQSTEMPRLGWLAQRVELAVGRADLDACRKAYGDLSVQFRMRMSALGRLLDMPSALASEMPSKSCPPQRSQS